jgi:hypothetical protein
MINRYHIVLQRDGRQWLASQLDCDKVVAWMGEQATYDGSLIAALNTAHKA